MTGTTAIVVGALAGYVLLGRTLLACSNAPPISKLAQALWLVVWFPAVAYHVPQSWRDVRRKSKS